MCFGKVISAKYLNAKKLFKACHIGKNVLNSKSLINALFLANIKISCVKKS